MTFTQFQNTRLFTETPGEDYPGYGYAQGEYGPGFIYNGGHLFIELLEKANGLDRREGLYRVDLFGDDFSGSLQDCEAELWSAARREGAFEPRDNQSNLDGGARQEGA